MLPGCQHRDEVVHVQIDDTALHLSPADKMSRTSSSDAQVDMSRSRTEIGTHQGTAELLFPCHSKLQDSKLQDVGHTDFCNPEFVQTLATTIRTEADTGKRLSCKLLDRLTNAPLLPAVQLLSAPPDGVNTPSARAPRLPQPPPQTQPPPQLPAPAGRLFVTWEEPLPASSESFRTGCCCPSSTSRSSLGHAAPGF